MRREKSVSYPCPFCGEFKGFPLMSPEQVETHVGNVHGKQSKHDKATTRAFAESLLDRLDGSLGLPSGPDGLCEDGCGHAGRLVRLGAVTICCKCARRRLQVAGRTNAGPRRSRGPTSPAQGSGTSVIGAADSMLEQQARGAADPGRGDAGPAALGTRPGRDIRDGSRNRAQTNLRSSGSGGKGDRS